MTEASLGLIVVAVVIIAFATAMRAMGALRTASAVTAAATTVAIATALFFTQ